MIYVCVPVLKRYDLLQLMLKSLCESQVEPAGIFVIDNGLKSAAVAHATHGFLFPIVVHTPEKPMGVAESWNWFINNVPEDRLITNDDVTFAPDSLEKLVEPATDLVWAAGVGFSCFVIRDSCVDKIGLFDETISPGYGYYEDEDYLQRIDGRGTRTPSITAANVEANVTHVKSQTLAAQSPQELNDHHRKFAIAQRNYVRKWNLQETFR